MEDLNKKLKRTQELLANYKTNLWASNLDHEEKLADLHKQLRAQKAETKRLEKELSLWHLFWGWVQAHSRPATLSYLSRLWKKGPRKATWDSFFQQ